MAGSNVPAAIFQQAYNRILLLLKVPSDWGWVSDPVLLAGDLQIEAVELPNTVLVYDWGWLS